MKLGCAAWLKLKRLLDLGSRAVATSVVAPADITESVVVCAARAPIPRCMRRCHGSGGGGSMRQHGEDMCVCVKRVPYAMPCLARTVRTSLI